MLNRPSTTAPLPPKNIWRKELASVHLPTVPAAGASSPAPAPSPAGYFIHWGSPSEVKASFNDPQISPTPYLSNSQENVLQAGTPPMRHHEVQQSTSSRQELVLSSSMGSEITPAEELTLSDSWGAQSFSSSTSMPSGLASSALSRSLNNLPFKILAEATPPSSPVPHLARSDQARSGWSEWTGFSPSALRASFDFHSSDQSFVPETPPSSPGSPMSPWHPIAGSSLQASQSLGSSAEFLLAHLTNSKHAAPSVPNLAKSVKEDASVPHPPNLPLGADSRLQQFQPQQMQVRVEQSASLPQQAFALHQAQQQLAFMQLNNFSHPLPAQYPPPPPGFGASFVVGIQQRVFPPLVAPAAVSTPPPSPAKPKPTGKGGRYVEVDDSVPAGRERSLPFPIGTIDPNNQKTLNKEGGTTAKDVRENLSYSWKLKQEAPAKKKRTAPGKPRRPRKPPAHKP